MQKRNSMLLGLMAVLILTLGTLSSCNQTRSRNQFSMEGKATTRLPIVKHNVIEKKISTAWIMNDATAGLGLHERALRTPPARIWWMITGKNWKNQFATANKGRVRVMFNRLTYC